MALGGLLALSDRRYRAVHRREIETGPSRLASGARPT